MVELELNEKDRQEAIEFDEMVMGRFSRKGTTGLNYTGLTKTGRFFIGRCGDIAVRNWADDLDLVFTETPADIGEHDEHDFVFHMRDGTDRTTDVKNTLHPRGRYMLVPISQMQKYHHDIYIGTNGIDNGTTVSMRIHGFATHANMVNDSEEKDFGAPSAAFELSKMPWDMNDLAIYVMKK